ncbi:MAG: hypothetical protein GXO10_07090 [Crenarchaeota archaeon]|nr:hypothetical protein [Thermoproteota archaeon]
MRYAIIYLLITIAFIAATLYTAYTIYNIGRQATTSNNILQAVECIYTRSICITTEPVINKDKYKVVIIGGTAVPTTKTINGNCTTPPCIIVSTSSEITIQKLSGEQK